MYAYKYVLFSTTTQQHTQSSMQIENKEEEQPQSFVTQQQLGLSWVGEIFKRMQHSKASENGTYYCFCDQVFNILHPATLIGCIQQLLEVERSLIQFVVFKISEFLIQSQEKLDDRGLILTIGANLSVAMQHATLFSQFPIEKLAIVKLVKVAKQEGLYCEYINKYLHTYISLSIYFLGLCVVFPQINKHKDNLTTICMHAFNKNDVIYEYIDSTIMNNIPLIRCSASDQMATADHPMHWITIAEGLHCGMKPYIQFELAEKTAETKDSGWDLAVKADFITPVLSSHKAVRIGRDLSHKYSNYHNIHTIKIWIKDYNTNVFDEWNVVYLSRCRSPPRSFTHPAPRVFQKTVTVRFIRHCDNQQTKWHWDSA